MYVKIPNRTLTALPESVVLATAAACLIDTRGE